MYIFSVGAMFKNESHCIKEWIEHYLNQGADHFYLVNDNSTDNTVEIIKPYIESGKITLYNAPNTGPHILGNQRNTYNKYILPHLNNKDTKWLLMCDLDEFAWSPEFDTVKDFLTEYVHSLAQVQVTPTIFGSNNLEKQPKSLVQGFTRRTKEVPTKCGTYKYFVNSDYKFSSLNVHFATAENPEYNKPEYFMIIHSDYIRLNHYICQSREFWLNIKCTRGDADGFLQRDLQLFESYNSQANQEEDYELAKINSKIKI
jgi:glycosyltransferase involved in cell wall biosynthesis